MCLDALHGSRRLNTLVALRSLFSFCKKAGMIFRDPASRIKVGQREHQLIQPLQPEQTSQWRTRHARGSGGEAVPRTPG